MDTPIPLAAGDAPASPAARSSSVSLPLWVLILLMLGGSGGGATLAGILQPAAASAPAATDLAEVRTDVAAIKADIATIKADLGTIRSFYLQRGLATTAGAGVGSGGR